MEGEVFQVEFANYNLKSLFAEGYYLSQDSRERKAIKAALNELEQARKIEETTILLEKGVIPPGYSAGSSASEEEIAKTYGTREAHVDSLVKVLSAQQKSNEGMGRFEDQIRNAFDYWHRRRTIRESELPR